MKKRKIIISALATSFALLGTTIGAVALTQFNGAFALEQKDGVTTSDYQLVVDAKNFDADTKTAKTKNGNGITFETTGTITPVEGTLGKFASGATIANIKAVNSIVSFFVETDSTDSKTFKLDYGYAKDTYVNQGIDFGVSYDKFDDTPSFIKLTANKDVTIKKLVFNYSCAESVIADKYNKNITIAGGKADKTKFALNSGRDNRKNQEYFVKATFEKDDVFKIMDGENAIPTNRFDLTSAGSAFEIKDMVVENDSFKVNTAGEYTFYVKYGTDNLNWVTAISKHEGLHLPEKFYLVPNDNWNQANARFAIYFVGLAGEKWVSMTKVGEENLYEATVPTDGHYNKAIFCRMNPGEATNGWHAKWNQTGDLMLEDNMTNNCYTINAGSWGDGAWSVYTPAAAK